MSEGGGGDEQYTGVDVQNAVTLLRLFHRDKGQFKRALEETVGYSQSGIQTIEDSAKRSLGLLVKEGIIRQEDIDKYTKK